MGQRFLISKGLLVLAWIAGKIICIEKYSFFLCLGSHHSEMVKTVFCVLRYLHMSPKTVKSVPCTVVLRNCLPLHPVNMERTEGTVATYSS